MLNVVSSFILCHRCQRKNSFMTLCFSFHRRETEVSKTPTKSKLPASHSEPCLARSDARPAQKPKVTFSEKNSEFPANSETELTARPRSSDSGQASEEQSFTKQFQDFLALNRSSHAGNLETGYSHPGISQGRNLAARNSQTEDSPTRNVPSSHFETDHVQSGNYESVSLQTRNLETSAFERGNSGTRYVVAENSQPGNFLSKNFQTRNDPTSHFETDNVQSGIYERVSAKTRNIETERGNSERGNFVHGNFNTRNSEVEDFETETADQGRSRKDQEPKRPNSDKSFENLNPNSKKFGGNRFTAGNGGAKDFVPFQSVPASRCQCYKTFCLRP
jgi:hypothetical protein